MQTNANDTQTEAPGPDERQRQINRDGLARVRQILAGTVAPVAKVADDPNPVRFRVKTEPTVLFAAELQERLVQRGVDPSETVERLLGTVARSVG